MIAAPLVRRGGAATILAVAALAAPIAGCAAHSEGRTADHADAAALASWRDGPTRSAIVSFVERTTDPSSPEFVPDSERIAVFDNDGTLWAERPIYVQLAFAIDRVRALAPSHPEWRETEPFASILRGDHASVAAQGEAAVAKIVAATHAGSTPEEFQAVVAAWLETARHPETGLPYDAMAYRPMLELLGYLRDRGFRTYIVSGGGVDFMRAFAERVYGVPPEAVIGSTGGMRTELRNGRLELVKQPSVEFINDKDGKPIGIERTLGRRPVIAVGNSDGDVAMLEWTTAGDGPRLGVLVHHTDAVREWAYDRASHVGRLDRGLDLARERGWVVVDMARDWEAVFVGAVP